MFWNWFFFLKNLTNAKRDFVKNTFGTTRRNERSVLGMFLVNFEIILKKLEEQNRRQPVRKNFRVE